MRALKHSLSLAVVVALAPALGGCPAFTGGAGARPDGHRLVEGTLFLPEDFVLGRQVSGVQLVAVSVRELDGAPSLEVHGSDVFAPDVGKAVPFALSVPVTRAFHLVLQTPKASGGAGAWLGVMRFEDGLGRPTSFIPAGESDLTLARLEARENNAGDAADNELSGPASHNPLSQIHSDSDEVSDLLDDDDDDDQVPDSSDSDVAGDGIDDALQMLEFLPDANGDAIPDDFQ